MLDDLRAMIPFSRESNLSISPKDNKTLASHIAAQKHVFDTSNPNHELVLKLQRQASYGVKSQNLQHVYSGQANESTN